MSLDFLATGDREVAMMRTITTAMDADRFYDIEQLPSRDGPPKIKITTKPFYRRSAFWGGLLAGAAATSIWLKRDR